MSKKLIKKEKKIGVRKAGSVDQFRAFFAHNSGIY